MEVRKAVNLDWKNYGLHSLLSGGSYRKFGITQRFFIEDTKERSQIRLMEVKKVTYGQTL